MSPKSSLLLNPKHGSHHGSALVGLLAAVCFTAGCSDAIILPSQSADLAGSGSLDLSANMPPSSYRVRVTLAGSGAGSVVSQPGTISCGAGATSCVGDYGAGTAVVLTATAAPGSVFLSWSGACAGQAAVCTLTVTADQATTTSFGLAPPADLAGSGGTDLSTDMLSSTFRVSVTRAGMGTGSVVSQPGTISCGSGTMVCAADYAQGTAVALTATGDLGSAFFSWSGACAGQGAVCTLTVNANQATTATFIPQQCSPDGACWEAPLPFGYDLNSVAAISATDVWAVGNSGAAVHYDGQYWSRVLTGTTQDLNDVWARNTNDVWATAGAGTMLHWDGTRWNKVATGFPTDITSLVWGTPTRLFVPTLNQYVLVYDGTTWVKQNLGTRPDTPLSAISGTGNNDVWVLGADRYICHYNGTTWSCTRPDPTVNPAYANYALTSGAFSVSATDIWEVTSPGYVAHNSSGPTGGLGFGFALQPTPIATGGGFSGLWGTSSTSLFTNGPGATLYRYDGTKWNASPTGVKDVASLSKVHGTANTDVWAVGQRGVIAHYDGMLAAVQRGNIFSGSNMTGVWASRASDAWFITSAGTAVHYSGGTYSESPALVTGGGAGLRTIWGTSSTDIWVGGTDGTAPVIKHWDGKTWTLVAQDPGYPGAGINTLYAASTTAAWAGGDIALGIQKWNGTAWKIDFALSKLNHPIRALWGSSATNVLAIEDGTTNLWRFDGATWATDSRISAVLYSLGGSGPSDVWAGASQSVYHFDGTTWTKTMLPLATGTIYSVSSVSATDAWAIDQLGGTFHYDGTTWKQLDTGISTASATPMSAFSVDSHLTWLAGRGILSVRK